MTIEKNILQDARNEIVALRRANLKAARAPKGGAA